MQTARKRYASVDEYILAFPTPVRKKLTELRGIIREHAPGAHERISYSHHIGFYPTASGIRAFRKKLSKYESSKGAVQFPMDGPLPRGLIRQMVRY